MDNLFFLTADSDQVPVLKHIRARFPEKRVYLVAPPNRLKEARELSSYAHHVFELTAGRLREHALPPRLTEAKGKKIAARPSVYNPHTKAIVRG